MGLALPLKILVWQDADNKVWVAYEKPSDMAAAHGLPADHPVIKRVTGAIDGLTNAAVKK